MHWMTKYTNKKFHAHSDMHSIIIMATLFSNHPYVSSSGTPVSNTCAGFKCQVTSATDHLLADFSCIDRVTHAATCICDTN